MNARFASPHSSSDSSWEMPLGMIMSVMLHLLVALLAIFGLPFIVQPPPPVEESVPVDLVPLGPVTAAPQPKAEQPKPVEKPPEKPPEPPKPEAKAEPPKPEPPKPEPPKAEPPKPTPPPPEPPKAEVPPPVPEKKPEPPKEEPKPAPDRLADIKPPPKKPPPPADDFQSLLKTIDKMKQPAPQQKPDDFKTLEKTLHTMQENQPAAEPDQKVAKAAPTIAAEASASDIDFVRAQIERHWNFDPGARDAANLIVQIRVALQPDGSVVRAEIVPDSRYDSDAFYRSAADTARRAVLAASPLQLPPGKYDVFRDFTFRFDPRNAIR